jgi:hypothetical protein
VSLLDAVRRKRNQITYELAGSASASEAAELNKVVTQFRSDVVRWLKKKHPTLCAAIKA